MEPRPTIIKPMLTPEEEKLVHLIASIAIQLTFNDEKRNTLSKVQQHRPE
jgi:hypothetical protein